MTKINDILAIPDKEHNANLADSLRGHIARIEGIKNLIRDGKIVVAYEKLQGVGDGLAYLLGIVQRRAEAPDVSTPVAPEPSALPSSGVMTKAG